MEDFYNKVGDVRPNQLITTFGPGAIVDSMKDSVTVLDINYWKEKGKKINDTRLSSYLQVDCFYSPRTTNMNDVPVVSFPYFHVCSSYKCLRLFDIRENYGELCDCKKRRINAKYFPVPMLTVYGGEIAWRSLDFRTDI